MNVFMNVCYDFFTLLIVEMLFLGMRVVISAFQYDVFALISLVLHHFSLASWYML